MKSRMKLFKIPLTLVITLLALCGKAQQYTPPTPIPPYNSPATVLTGNFSSGTQNLSAYNVELNTVNVSGTDNYDVTARQVIDIKPGCTEAGFGTGGVFHAHIVPAPFDVVSFHPFGWNNIPRYDKFELGIKLPQDLTDRVNNFFGNTNTVTDQYAVTTVSPCINGYGNAFAGAYPNINPYDPDQISVEATFSFPGKPSQTVYGFYYREYTYSGNATNQKYTTTDWQENTSLDYHWRVRFCPRYVGTYNVTWVIKAYDSNGNLQVVYTDNAGQNFSTQTSVSKGFIKIGQYGKFLVTQPDEAGPQQCILPLGLGDATPDPGFCHDPNNPVDGADDDIPQNDCSPWGCILKWGGSKNNYSYPSRFWRHRNEIKSGIVDKGGNLVRIMSAPYGFDIEWEKLGVYDADPKKPLGNIASNRLGTPTIYHGTNRQAYLFELDRLFDMAKDNNLYIQWVIDDFNSNGFSIATPTDPDDPNYWGNNVYRNYINASLSTVQQFFTDVNARKTYKKRLRYLIARYGYSTNLGVLEMANEIHNQVGNLPGNTVDNVIKPWLEEMISYIKNDLNHKDHLVTVSYELATGCSAVGQAVGLDFVSEHPYAADDGSLSYSREFFATQQLRGITGKPCQPGEFGIRAGWGNNHNIACPHPIFPEGMLPSYHGLLWSSAFVGGLTSGLNNWVIGKDNESIWFMCGGEDNDPNYFRPLNSFITGYNHNLDQENFAPNYSSTSVLEAFYLEDYSAAFALNAIGYVRNKFFWWHNFRNPNSNYFYDPSFASVYSSYFTPSSCLPPNSPNSQYVITGNLGSITLSGFMHNMTLNIDWYDTYTDPPAHISSGLISTDNFGSAVITPPVFDSYDCFKQEYAFQISLGGGNKLASSASSSTTPSESEMTRGIPDRNIFVYPNPASDILYIQYAKEQFNDFMVELTDEAGRSVLKQANTDHLSIATLKSGFYLLKFTGDNYQKTFKINIQH